MLWPRRLRRSWPSRPRRPGGYTLTFRVDSAPKGSGVGIPADGLMAFRLHVSQVVGHYFREVLEDAGREFGLTPYGTEGRARPIPNVFPG